MKKGAIIFWVVLILLLGLAGFFYFRFYLG